MRVLFAAGALTLANAAPALASSNTTTSFSELPVELPVATSQDPSTPWDSRRRNSAPKLLNMRWEDCGAEYGKVTGFYPDSMILDQFNPWVAETEMKEKIAAGNFTLEVDGPKDHLHISGDLCRSGMIDLPYDSGVISLNGVKCPQAAGHVRLGAVAIIREPFLEKFADAKITVRAHSSQGHKLLCLKLSTRRPDVALPTDGVVVLV